MQNQGASAQELLALLLLALPLLLTLQKLLLLPELGERSHQLLAEPPQQPKSPQNTTRRDLTLE